MLIKETANKINFIDSNDNFVGFDWHSQCCEQFSYHVAPALTHLEPETEPSLEGFRFDTASPALDVEGGDAEEAIVAFKCVNDEGEVLYLHLTNTHNGYYSHGWESSFAGQGDL